MKIDTRAVLASTAILVLSGCGQRVQVAEEPQQPESSPTLTGRQTAQTPKAGAIYEGTVRGKISESGSRFVVEDSSTGAVYVLSEEPGLKSFVGKTVTIEGHIDPNSRSIHVHHISPAG
ncbi:MAG TPA: hypothetical protein V6D08_07220 [Candidatus Obscuribacterales bacterium]